MTGDMSFPGGETHITRDMCFPGRGMHITRDTCFQGKETHTPNCNNVVIEESKKPKAKGQIGIN